MDIPAPDSPLPTTADVLVVGAGPAGSSAAAWAARAGHEVVLVDAAVFPRDKTCGDGLTPRAMAELDRLGLAEWAHGRTRNRGLRLAGFGRESELPWPDCALPRFGSAVPRIELDDMVRRAAMDSGAVMVSGARAVEVTMAGDRVAALTVRRAEVTHDIRCRTLIVADGVRSPVGKLLGRVWHRDNAYGVAARAYIKSERSEDEWITSHLELRDEAGALQPGYGWVFPLANGEVNIGVGSLSTGKRPAKVQLRPLLERYTELRRDEWQLAGGILGYASALLPMGGAVSGVAGRNWALVGDAAACVNPLNGEGIDYGLEGGRLVADILAEADLRLLWPDLLRAEYGTAFSIARRLAGIATVPGSVRLGGPPVMRSQRLMRVLIRLMGNLVTEEDSDFLARVWRTTGRASARLDHRPPFT